MVAGLVAGLARVENSQMVVQVEGEVEVVGLGEEGLEVVVDLG